MSNDAKILIIDDDVDLALTLKDILQEEGYSVGVAHTAREALSLCEKEPFAVVVSDIKLPDISGLALVGQLVQVQSGIEVIIVTGNASIDTAVDAVAEKHIVAYKTKPLDVSEFLVLLRQVIERKRAEDALGMYQDSLEQLVEERTEALERANRELRIEIDERRRVEENLTALLASMDDLVFVVGTDGRFESFFQPSKEESLYLPPERFIGKHFRQVLPPDVAALTGEAVDKLKISDEVQQFDYSMEVGGRERWFNARLSPNKDQEGRTVAVTAVIRDFTAHRQNEEIIRKSERKYRELIEASIDAVISIDKEMRVVMWNRGAENIFGYTSEEMLGQSLLKIVPLRYCKSKQKGFEKFVETGVGLIVGKVVQMEGITRSGAEVPIELSVSSSGDDETWFATAMLRDISRRKREETEREESLREAQQRQRELSAFLQGTRAVLTLETFEQTARSVFDTCRDLIGATSGYVALLSDDGMENEVLFLDSGGLPCSVDPSLPMPIRGLRGQVYHTGQAAYENDFCGSDWIKFMPEGHVELRNVMFAPLMLGEKVVGLIGLANKPGGFNPNDARLAATFGELAAIALRSSRRAEALKNSEQRYRAIFEQAGDLILLVDLATGRIVDFNDATCQRLGYSRREFKRIRSSDLLADKNDPTIIAHMQRVRQKGKDVFEIRLKTKDSKIRNVRVNSRRLDLDDRQLFISVWHDMTAVKRAEAAESRARELEEVNRLRNSILASVSHELRTPLTVIKGYSDMLTRPDLKLGDEDIQDALGSIEKESDVLTGLVDQLIQMSRLEAGMLEISKNPREISWVIQKVSNNLTRLTRKYDLQIDVPDDLPALDIDEVRIAQVITNLVSNAASFSSPGSSIILRARRVDDDIVVSVTDEGIGISKKHIDKIFDRFYRVESGVSHRRGGMGLGLSVCKWVVEAHGGKIWVESKPDKGSTFSFSLPVN